MNHIKMVMKERMDYNKKKHKAVLLLARFSSIIVNSADVSASQISHFVKKSKQELGTSVKLRLIGLLYMKREPASFLTL